jgi:hypothetical protein
VGIKRNKDGNIEGHFYGEISGEDWETTGRAKRSQDIKSHPFFFILVFPFWILTIMAII